MIFNSGGGGWGRFQWAKIIMMAWPLTFPVTVFSSETASFIDNGAGGYTASWRSRSTMMVIVAIDNVGYSCQGCQESRYVVGAGLKCMS
jgi:hypothetical protein